MISKKESKQQAIGLLLEHHITPSDTIGICIKSISQSGISRRMRVYTKKFDDITYYIAEICNLSLNDTGLLIKGCGMDMTFWLANYITTCLWNKKQLKRFKNNEFKGNGGQCINWKTL